MMKRVFLVLILTLFITAEAYADGWDNHTSDWNTSGNAWNTGNNNNTWNTNGSAWNTGNNNNTWGTGDGSWNSSSSFSDNSANTSSSDKNASDDKSAFGKESTTSRAPREKIGLDLRASFVMPVLPTYRGYTRAKVFEEDDAFNFHTLAPAASIFLGYHINGIITLGFEQHIGETRYYGDNTILYSLFRGAQDLVHVGDEDKDIYAASYFVAKFAIPATQELSFPIIVGLGAIYGKSSYEATALAGGGNLDFGKITVPTPQHQAAFSAKLGASMDYVLESGFLLSLELSYALSIIPHKEAKTAFRIMHYVEPQLSIGYIF